MSLLFESRQNYPYNPPVNPNVMNSVIQTVVPSSSDLYAPFNEHENVSTNQLYYSGGTNKLIKIPLQVNDPTDEQLRSQDILITPYNRIKYSSSSYGC